ncbi:3'(2'),5'-bisphosphate nucleotidase CysQ [Rufibacter roseus]|uniref:3'(2'),5'-bisphosphate nucleotidase CysQ n=1 Tax=Rufibacter roseus TaxID=1567108 RepID=A0ABW2DRB5_9BACT|nr:3'(2'),5'-bisphosphate nucleotidase CysQ [Rufibacter roseus]
MTEASIHSSTSPTPPPPPNLNLWVKTARTAALEAGKAILAVYETVDFGVEHKGDHSPLTKADKAAHHIIFEMLQPLGLPILSEEGKEILYKERKDWEWYWLVDPLDGTKEFIKRNGEFTVNIALMHQQVPVAGVIYAPTVQTLYFGSAETGVTKESPTGTETLTPLPHRYTLADLKKKPNLKVIASKSHRTPETDAFIQQFQKPASASMGSSFKFMLLAEGKADIYPRFAPTMEWDTAASHAILNALNRSIYQTDLTSELKYNKPDLLNPSFVAF